MLQVPASRFAFPQPALKVVFVLAAAFLLLASAPRAAYSQTYNVIHNFTGQGSDGASPYGGPTLDRSGNVYGTTYLGGTSGNGTVYELSPNGSSWQFTTLNSFTGSNGSGPGFGSLVLRHNCSLFGTTEAGGPFGIAFRVRPVGNPCSSSKSTWHERVVHAFGIGQDGAQPLNGVVFDSAANFYGTTSLGGAYGNGAVFQATSSGEESVIYSFTGGNDGTNPVASVAVDASGNLYGTTSFGGANFVGVVYELSPSGSGWTQTVLYTFQGLSDGQYPVGGVVLDKAGNIFGTTFGGGDNGGGTIYELSPSGGSWTFTTVYSFTGSFGGPYNKLVFDANGNIYGATNGDGAYGVGSVFKLTPNNGSWTLTDLYDFTGGSDGATPYGSVAVDHSGNIFGTTAVGGSENQGVVFEITP